MTPAELPLEGITVVSLEQAIAAPFCTRQLADLGARVIKIERPDGGDFARGYDSRVKGLSSHFVWTNRSKESLTLDLKQPAGLDALKRLIGRADVLVQNLAPGATAPIATAKPTICWCKASRVFCRSPAAPTTWPRRAVPSWTSPQACMPTVRFWLRS
jgi:hypothetical protein